MQESTKKTIKETIRDLPPLIREELDSLEKKIREYQAGMLGEIKFQKIRLQMGTYAQRQNGVQMQRIKIPYGGLTSHQLRRLADVTEKYASGFMHLTTRQDVQIYYVKLATVPNMMRELADAGITTREACGNTVRNVTACHQSGISKTETFDVTPYTDAFVQFMLRNPICQNMGRKFKVAFEGCSDKDHAGVRIHDLGFRARVKEIDGELRRGFQLYVGGGLGASPSLGYLWSDFIPAEEMLPLSASIIRIFDRYGERKVRMKARMKFLVRKLGFEEFRKRVEEERAQMKVDPLWNDYLKTIDEHENAPEVSTEIPPAPEGIDCDPGYIKWKESCVVPHREDGYRMVHVRIKLGDIESERARKLADIAEIFSGGEIRITIQQNFVLRWVPEDCLPSLYAALREADLTYLGADTFEDITACPGADTCRLGITSAKGLAGRLSDGMANGLSEYKEMAKDLKIKISGCPNSCAQHVSASIGFQGASINHEGRTVPAEMVFVGGSLLGDDTRLAIPIKKIPTRNAPKVVKKLLDLHRDEKDGDEDFDMVMQRLGADRIKKELDEFTSIPSFEEDPAFYQDWGHEEEKFEVQQGVKGECAGATVEEKIPTFKDAEKHLEKAHAFLHHGELKSSIIESYHACSATAHVPLYTKLVDPFTDEQTIWEFENMLVRTGEADSKWINIAARLREKLNVEPTKEIAEELLAVASDMHAECQQIQMNLTQARKN